MAVATSIDPLVNSMAPAHPGFTSAAHTGPDAEHVLQVSARMLAEIAATT